MRRNRKPLESGTFVPPPRHRYVEPDIAATRNTIATRVVVPRAAFDRGQAPKIVVFNDATIPLGFEMAKLVSALQAYVNDHIVPIWGTKARIVQSKGFVKGAWAIGIFDNADIANTLGYHDLTPEGLPLGMVFAKTIRESKASLSITISHELAEMLVDPAINLMATGPDVKAVYAYEVADPVQATSFLVNGFKMSNFVYPSYFEAFRLKKTTRFDHLDKIKEPFQILSDGFQIIFKGGKWTNVFGSKKGQRAYLREDHRGYRGIMRRAL